MINIGEWTDFEMGKGIPQYSKVFLQMKRPPLVIEFKYKMIAGTQKSAEGVMSSEIRRN